MNPTHAEIKEAIARRISADGSVPSMDSCCDYAGWGHPDGPAVTWHAVERLRMAALLEVMAEWYASAAEDEEGTASPFPALDPLMENDNSFDMEDLSRRLLAFADYTERNVVEVALDDMQEHLADVLKEDDEDDRMTYRADACERLRKRIARS